MTSELAGRRHTNENNLFNLMIDKNNVVMKAGDRFKYSLGNGVSATGTLYDNNGTLFIKWGSNAYDMDVASFYDPRKDPERLSKINL